MKASVMVVLAALTGLPALACDAPPEPVGALSYGSRYTDDSNSRSEIDEDGEAEAEAALKPIDDFLRDLTERANNVLRTEEGRAAADCIVQQLAVWSRADAMGDLRSKTAGLTIGSRIAGFALVMLQVAPQSGRADDLADINRWLGSLVNAQMTFWEDEAPRGARQGNLRAWATLAASATARLTGDANMRAWASWSVNYLLCKADPDGSLPQEMKRGKLALKYQLHAIAPLVVSTLLLEQDDVAVKAACNGALGRIVNFALDDLETGAATAEITGKDQSFFTGSDTLEGFHLAWVVPYAMLEASMSNDRITALADRYGPLNYSKLGGNQKLLWQALQ